jgi:beta-galactosidase
MKLFHGQLVVVVRSAKQAGNLTLTVKDKQRKQTKKVTLNIKN